MTTSSHTSCAVGVARRGLSLIAFILSVTASLALAQTAGTIAGRVTDDSNKAAVSGASVTITGTNQETSTNQQGEFVLVNVPGGDTSVTVNYLGLATKTMPVTVRPGEVSRLDVVMAQEVVQMEGIKVSGSTMGSARALNQQRVALTFTNIIAADLIGQLPDKNIAEALQRVPGVDVAKDKGEGRFVIIRGLDPIYLGVSMNGIRLSSAEKAARSSALDVVASSLVATMETTKVVTPDMETDAIGSVNIKTHSAFEQEGRHAMITAGSGYSHQLNRKGSYNTAATYSDDTLLDNKLGVAVTVAADNRKFSVFSEPETTIWSQVKSPTDGQIHWLLGGQDFRDYDGTRWRQGVSASLDYKLSSTNKAYLRMFSSSYRQNNEQWLTTFGYGTGTIQALTDTSATVTIPAKQIIQSETQIVNNKRVTSIVAGEDATFGSWTNKFAAGYTTGKYTRPSLQIAFSNTAATGISYSFNGPYDNRVTQISGPSIALPSSYSFSTKSGYSNTTSNMHEVTIHDDLRRDFTFNESPSYVKFGAEYRTKHNNLDTFKEAITSAPWTFANEINPGLPVRNNLGGYPKLYIRQEAVQSFYQNQDSYGQTLTVATTYGSAFQALEDSEGAYLMGGTTFGKLKVTAGARAEHTHFWIKGWEYNATTTAVKPVVSENNYTNVLPSVVFTYDFSKNTIGRASWNNTLARPDYSGTAPGRAINDSARTVTQGNAELKPLTAMSWDASIEHYYSPRGVVSAAVFYKDLKNFAYQAQAGTDAGTGYLLTTYLNGTTASIYGLELNWAQRLGFLPAPFNGLGVEASGTFGKSEATYPNRPGEKVPFTGFAKKAGNFAVTYDYRGFHGRVAAHYHGVRLESGSALGADATQDSYEEPYVSIDVGLSYKLATGWQIYLDGGNLNEAPKKTYFGGTGSFKRISTYESYGWSAESGIRWNF